MKIRFIIAGVVLIACLACTHGCGQSRQSRQSRLEGGGHISTSWNVGYGNPNAGVFGSGQFHKGRFALTGSLDYLPIARKYTGDGQAISLEALARGYLINRFYLAGGIAARKQFTSEFEKTSANLTVGIGLNPSNLTTVQISYELPDFASFNHVSGWRFDFERLAQIGEREYISIKPRAIITRFDQPGRGRLTGLRLGISIGIGRFL